MCQVSFITIGSWTRGGISGLTTDKTPTEDQENALALPSDSKERDRHLKEVMLDSGLIQK